MAIDLAAILTGGAARRMDGSKADLDLGGVSMTQRVWERVNALAATTICVGGDPMLTHIGVQTIEDLYPGASSLGGIATALSFAEKEIGPDAMVLCVGCDMPLISPKLIEYMDQRSGGHDIVSPRTKFGFEPLCTIYRAGIHSHFAKRIRAGELKTSAAFEGLDVVVVSEKEVRGIDAELHSFININRPSDLEIVRGLMGSASSFSA